METQAQGAERQHLTPEEVRAILIAWSEQQSVADLPTVQDVAEVLDIPVAQVQALRAVKGVNTSTPPALTSSQEMQKVTNKALTDFMSEIGWLVVAFYMLAGCMFVPVMWGIMIKFYGIANVLGRAQFASVLVLASSPRIQSGGVAL